MAVKYPKSVGACIDMLYEQRAERLKLQKIVDNAKVEEAKLEEHILGTFGKEELGGAKGKLATAAIKRDTTVSVTNWDELRDWIVKTKSWDILRKQPSSTAIKERWSSNEQVPGCEPFVRVSLSLTKI